jgi:hypothetical protein
MSPLGARETGNGKLMAPSIDSHDHDRKILVFIHVPKTGGMTIHGILRETFGRSYKRTKFHRHRAGHEFLTPEDVQRDLVPMLSNLQAISGHLLRPPIQVPNANVLYATILRDPFSWALSHYFHAKRQNWIPQDATFHTYMNDYYTLPNFQTYHFAASGLATDAIPVLERFMAVGVTDMIPEFLHVLRIRLKREMQKSIRIRHHRVNAARNRSLTPLDLTDMEMKQTVEKFGEDLKLYHYARYRSLKDWKECPLLTRVASRLRARLDTATGWRVG